MAGRCKFGSRACELTRYRVPSDKKIIGNLVDRGLIDPSEVPFDEDENKAPDTGESYALPYTIILSTPIEHVKGDPIKELVFLRAPSAGSCLHMPIVGSDLKFGHYVPIIGYCTGLSDVVIKKLDFPDFRKAVELVSHFLLGRGQ